MNWDACGVFESSYSISKWWATTSTSQQQQESSFVCNCWSRRRRRRHQWVAEFSDTCWWSRWWRCWHCFKCNSLYTWSLPISFSPSLSIADVLDLNIFARKYLFEINIIYEIHLRAKEYLYYLLTYVGMYLGFGFISLPKLAEKFALKHIDTMYICIYIDTRSVYMSLYTCV